MILPAGGWLSGGRLLAGLRPAEYETVRNRIFCDIGHVVFVVACLGRSELCIRQIFLGHHGHEVFEAAGLRDCGPGEVRAARRAGACLQEYSADGLFTTVCMPLGGCQPGLNPPHTTNTLSLERQYHVS